MKRLLIIGLVALAGCGGGDSETWGGLTEDEAKDVMVTLRQEVIQNAPGDPATHPYNQLIPEQFDDVDLRKVTQEGQETWEYRDAENNFCFNVWTSGESEAANSYVGICNSD